MESEVIKIANQAKDLASQANHAAMSAEMKVDSYIKVMTVQHEVMNNGIQKVEAKINALYNRAWTIAITFIGTLLSAIGILAMYILNRIPPS